MEKAFEVIDHTADIGIIAYGADVKQLFSNAASGMYSLLLEGYRAETSVQQVIELQSTDKESLLVEWLNELLYLFDTEYLVFSQFEFDRLDDEVLKARCMGITIDLKRNRPIREVKAATYHMLTINKDKNGYKAQVIFDI